MKSELLEHWRISTFRLAMLFGLVFTLAIIALLGLIYWQTAGYLTQQTDIIIHAIARGLAPISERALPAYITDISAHDMRKITLYGFFARDGQRISGNLPLFPSKLPIDGTIHQFAHTSIAQNSTISPTSENIARAMAIRLPSGAVLVLGRDFTQLAEIRTIILNALIGGGLGVLVLGLLGGFALSIKPLRRINAIRDVSQRIILGDLSLRMPIAGHHDELDMLASTVNSMLVEIERLLTEVKSVTDTLAHDLRTPLTRLRALLYRTQQQNDYGTPQYNVFEQALAETDALLGRFRALLRIAEIENCQRQAGFIMLDLHPVVLQIYELFEVLAEEKSVQLNIALEPTALIYADPELLFEALSNIVDNAIKFTPSGGHVTIKLMHDANSAAPRIDVIDNGIGIAINEREAVLQRFYRSHRHQPHSTGYGLGLSIVSAIVQLHGFHLEFQEAAIGTHLVLYCFVGSSRRGSNIVNTFVP